MGRSERWRDTDTGEVVVPREDLDLLLLDRAQWRAWAKGLERAGRWAR